MPSVDELKDGFAGEVARRRRIFDGGTSEFDDELHSETFFFVAKPYIMFMFWTGLAGGSLEEVIEGADEDESVAFWGLAANPISL